MLRRREGGENEDCAAQSILQNFMKRAAQLIVNSALVLVNGIAIFISLDSDSGRFDYYLPTFLSFELGIISLIVAGWPSRAKPPDH